MRSSAPSSLAGTDGGVMIALRPPLAQGRLGGAQGGERKIMESHPMVRRQFGCGKSSLVLNPPNDGPRVYSAGSISPLAQCLGGLC